MWLVQEAIIRETPMIEFIVNLFTGRDRSLWWHSVNGKYEVLYYDGEVSQPFTKSVARDYAKMFVGTVRRIRGR